MENNCLDWKTVFKKILLKDSVAEENYPNSTQDRNFSSKDKSFKKDSENSLKATNSTLKSHVENSTVKKFPTELSYGNKTFQNKLEDNRRTECTPGAQTPSTSNLNNYELKCNDEIKSSVSEYNLNTNAVSYKVASPSEEIHSKFHNKDNTHKEISRHKIHTNASLYSQVSSNTTNADHLCEYKYGANERNMQSEIHSDVDYFLDGNVRKKGLKPFTNELPAGNKISKDILSENNQTEDMHHEPSMPSPSTMSINKQSKNVKCMQSQHQKQTFSKPQHKGKSKGEIKRSLTGEKQVEQLHGTPHKCNLNDFEGAGINIFKTQDLKDEHRKMVACRNKDSVSTNTKYKTVESNVNVEWTKLTRYTYKDAMAAKDRIVSSEVWELDDNFRQQYDFRLKYSKRRYK